MNETADALLKNIDDLTSATPDDDLLTAAAEALEAEGRPAEAAQLLVRHRTNVTGYEEPTLPGLCKRTLDPARVTAEAEGFRFRREFALAHGRVLFFWVPEELTGRKALRRSVASRLQARLRPRSTPAAASS